MRFAWVFGGGTGRRLPAHGGGRAPHCPFLDHGVEAAALAGDGVGLDAAPAAPRAVAGGEDGGQVRRPERPASARCRPSLEL